MGTLFVVATPIGNLEDISLRALRVLREASLIAAEDTRHTHRLLAHYDIPTRMTSYFEHNKLAKLDAVLEALSTGDVALVSDAGTPGLSDPGYELVRAAISAGHSVAPIPGPSAITSALVVSGLPTDQFVYVGFLPRRAGERRRLIRGWREERRTLVCFEAPHRLCDTLADIATELGDRPVAVCQELTKLYERVFRGPVSDAIAHFAAEPPRGEYTLVVGGATDAEPPATADEIDACLSRLLAETTSTREAVDRARLELHIDRRTLYRRAHELVQGTEQRGNM